MQKNMPPGIFLFQIYYICKDEQMPSYHSDYIHAGYGYGYDGHVHYANASLRCCIFPFRFILGREHGVFHQPKIPIHLFTNA